MGPSEKTFSPFSNAFSAISTAFCTPKQKPDCLSISTTISLLFDNISDPNHLLGNTHPAVVENYCVISSPERADIPVLIRYITGNNCSLDLLKINVYAFANKLFVPSFCPYIDRSCHKYLYICSWKNHCANVSSIHHDAFGNTDLTLQLYHSGPYFRNLAYTAYMRCYFHIPDLPLHIFRVQECLVFVYIRIIYKVYLNILKTGNYCIGIHSIVADITIPHAIERHGTVHCSAVNENIFKLFCNQSCKSAFPA